MNSEIKINIELNEERFPDKITWFATDSDMQEPKESNSFTLALWDAAEKQTLGIDLWTEKMTIEEMNMFFFQILIKMSDTYKRATHNEKAAKLIEDFANSFAAEINKEQ